jgi:hypothetical protein
VVVAVVSVRVVQVPVDQKVDVVAMRHRFMPASGPVHMARLVPLALVLGRAAIGVLIRDLDHVLIDVIAVRMLQMAAGQIIDVAAVANRLMAATRTVLVRAAGLTSAHGWPPCSSIEVQRVQPMDIIQPRAR